MLKLFAALFTLTTVLGQCPNDPYCLNCVKEKCEVCIYSYYDTSSNICVPTQTVAHCTAYKDAATCNSCAPRFYLDNNICMPIDMKDCVIAQKVNQFFAGANLRAVVCMACADKILLTNGECSPLNKCKEMNCRSCAHGNNNKEICIRCEDKFVLNPLTGGCVKQITDGCLTLDNNDTNFCGLCIPGYFGSKSDTCVLTKVYDSTKDFNTQSKTTSIKNIDINNTQKIKDKKTDDKDESVSAYSVFAIALIAILLTRI